MGRAEDRKAIVAEINQAAKLYRGFLVGKSFMYVFDDRYIEVIYKAENFKHLTGVDSHLSAKQFFKLASRGKLAASQIDFSNRHPYALCRRKVNHIVQLASFATSACFMLEDISIKSQCYKFGTTDLNFSLLMNYRGGCYIAESLRDEDCFSKAHDVHLVTHIFSRQNDKKLYDSLLFKDGEFDDSQLPRTIRSLLDPSLLAH